MSQWDRGITCAECGRMNYAIQRSRRAKFPTYCSECRRQRVAAQMAAFKDRRRNPRTDLACSVCGLVFEKTYPSQVACSKACRRVDKNRKNRAILRASQGRTAEPGYVYLVAAEQSGWVKIGFSAETLRRKRGRLKALQNGNPERLRLVCEMPADREVECRLHEEAGLRTERGVGEWFRFDVGLLVTVLSECRIRGGWVSAHFQREGSAAIVVPGSWTGQHSVRAVGATT